VDPNGRYVWYTDHFHTKGKDGKAHKHPAMGSDLMRWMYCRTNPASNINFGPHVAEEIRNKLIMKLWNSFAFFCNYARLDNFDPATPQVPVKDRPDIDRWILSDLQLLIQSAREAFESFNVMAFCLKAEEFVDDKLSNWYVRRNRRPRPELACPRACPVGRRTATPACRGSTGSPLGWSK